MMVEAEPIIKHNWLDVALHDKRKIDAAPCDHFFAWILTEIGSHLIPMYSETKEKSKIEGTEYKYITASVCHFLTKNNLGPLANLGDHSYYFVVKRNTLDGGDIIPVDLLSFVDFVSSGNWTWIDGQGIVYT